MFLKLVLSNLHYTVGQTVLVGEAAVGDECVTLFRCTYTLSNIFMSKKNHVFKQNIR